MDLRRQTTQSKNNDDDVLQTVAAHAQENVSLRRLHPDVAEESHEGHRDRHSRRPTDRTITR